MTISTLVPATTTYVLLFLFLSLEHASTSSCTCVGAVGVALKSRTTACAIGSSQIVTSFSASFVAPAQIVDMSLRMKSISLCTTVILQPKVTMSEAATLELFDYALIEAFTGSPAAYFLHAPLISPLTISQPFVRS